MLDYYERVYMAGIRIWQEPVWENSQRTFFSCQQMIECILLDFSLRLLYTFKGRFCQKYFLFQIQNYFI